MICPYCNGDGRLEYEIQRPHNFNRDVGYIDTKWGECRECNGAGEIESNDDED